MARQQTKKLAAVTTGPAESSGIPCATVLTLMAYSPRGPGFLAPVIARLVTAGDLTSASGGQDHTLLRPLQRRSSARDRARRCRVHRIPRPTCRDDRPKRPSSSEAGWHEP